MTHHPVVAHPAWLAARRELLEAEKAFTRSRDELARQRRALPWEAVTAAYEFATPQGPRSLDELFGASSQLFVYHFMLGPGWGEGCKSCSYLADHFDGMLPHLTRRDVAFVAVSSAPWPRSRRSRRAWAGVSHGCRRTAVISTSITTPPRAPPISPPGAVPTTTRHARAT